MTTVRRAHMVSKGYLRAWADARNTVDVVDIQQRRGFPSSIVNATVASYAYDTSVLTHDLERDYARIEDSGIPVILKLRNGEGTLTEAERSAMIAFLDMHLNRRRYADQTEVRIPAALLMNGGELKEAELSLGDRLLLSQSLTDVVRVAALGVERWPWRVVGGQQHLATGDGAVLLWNPTDGAEICTVSFPLSPTQLLVIGEDLPDVPINDLLARNSRRWLVAERGQLRMGDNSR